jgi:hypothetical protein
VRAVQHPQRPVLHVFVHKPRPKLHKGERGEGDGKGKD